ncbi:hypothetical protein E4U21_003549 [Claviceps maximensis]|nr:hypothetical protein E4U21_003549 [Claviceps maximensis]
MHIALLTSLLCGIMLPVAAIIGGEPARWKDYPYIVSFFKDGDPRMRLPPAKPLTIPAFGPDCTGALLPRNAVITSFSCLNGMDKLKSVVGIGPPGNQTYHAIKHIARAGPGLPFRGWDASHEQDIALVAIYGEHRVKHLAKIFLTRRRPKYKNMEFQLVAPRALHVITDADREHRTDLDIYSANPSNEADLDTTYLSQRQLEDMTFSGLRQMTVSVVRNRQCWKQLKNYRIPVSISKFCTTSCTSRGTSDRYSSLEHSAPRFLLNTDGAMSNSDTGAPLLWNDRIVGILSLSPAKDDNDLKSCPYRTVAHFAWLKSYFDRFFLSISPKHTGIIRDYFATKQERDPWEHWDSDWDDI